jgi:transposase
MSEFGVILPLRSVTVRKQAATAAEALPELARRVVSDLLEQMRSLDQRIEGYDREIEAQARLSEPARRLMKIRGIGATTALAIVATVGNAREFKNGRQFAAWIGLVPGQYSTGGRPRLGHISKRGDAYLRNLLVQGARSVLQSAGAHQDHMSRWILALLPRRGYYRTLVAIANKNARIAWALLAKNETLRTA